MIDSELIAYFPKAKIYNLTDYYSEFVPFTMNSVFPIHRWYRFKEGFSRDLVHLILGMSRNKINSCLDPFSGSGTVPLVCQEVGIRCYSMEVNPFLFNISRAKLNQDYIVNDFDKSIAQVKKDYKRFLKKEFPIPEMSTITKREKNKKWLFSLPVLQAILNLRYCFKRIDDKYSNLLLVILASILPDIGNTTKDGKCVRYKQGWKDMVLTSQSVIDLFLERSKIFREDINYIENLRESLPNNYEICTRGSALDLLRKFNSDPVDSIITSPPYLNSFDYTDVYMPELWALGFVNSYEDVQNLRSSTLRSHVQVNWDVNKDDLNPIVKDLVEQISANDEELWNPRIPDMIAGYFLDMRDIFSELRRIIRMNGKCVIIVGTSSYCGVTIPTDLLIADYAREAKFELEEIRILRNLKRSSKQSNSQNGTLPPLRESMLILRNT